MAVDAQVKGVQKALARVERQTSREVKKAKADAKRTTDMYTKHFNQQVGW